MSFILIYTEYTAYTESLWFLKQIPHVNLWLLGRCGRTEGISLFTWAVLDPQFVLGLVQLLLAVCCRHGLYNPQCHHGIIGGVVRV